MRLVFLTTSILGISSAAFGQAIYSNGSASPGVPALGTTATTQSGVPAPNGTLWSEVPSVSGVEAGAVAGFSSHNAGAEGHFRFADDVLVSGGGGWRLDAITVYAYQTGVNGGVPPFSGLSVRIWNAAPGSPGAQVVWGDATTNRMTGSVAAGVYRVFNTTTLPTPVPADTTRKLWATSASLGGLALLPGRYWIDWQYTCTNPDGAAYSPPATLPGQRGVPGANALQFRQAVGPSLDGWYPLLDSGKPAAAADVAQDLPFVISGTGINPCDPDFNQDGNADQDDVAYLINIVAGGENPTGRDPDFNLDGNVDQDDYVLLVSVIAGGACP